MKRRTILKGTLAMGVIGTGISAGLLTPRSVLAAWPKSAFSATSVGDALNAMYATDKRDSSSKIHLKAPDIAENGAVVQITVSADMDHHVDAISIIAEKNVNPMAASFQLTEHSNPFVATRIKLGKTSNVIAVVKSNGKLYSTQKEVKVTIGGCGG
ncbi:MAG: thiosulfate oxidation carrier protein SoxY [Gammaproteobacteria bacterium]|nr:thiosulfate oxidation carrier protein SoxY [Gammaproteobacteria bacterium]